MARTRFPVVAVFTTLLAVSPPPTVAAVAEPQTTKSSGTLAPLALPLGEGTLTVTPAGDARLTLAADPKDPRRLVFRAADGGAATWATGTWLWGAARGPVNVSVYDRLVLRVRADVANRPADLSVALTSPALPPDGPVRPGFEPPKRATTAAVRLSDYEYEWSDGAWHTFLIPVADLLRVVNRVDAAAVDGLALAAGTEGPDGAAPGFAVRIAEARFERTPPPTPEPPLSLGERRHRDRMAAVKARVATLGPDATRGVVELLFPVRDPSFERAGRARYWCGDEVMVEVAYDLTGGPESRENRVKGAVKVLRGKMAGAK